MLTCIPCRKTCRSNSLQRVFPSYFIYCRRRKMPKSIISTLMKPFLMCRFDFSCLHPATEARCRGSVLLLFVHYQSRAALKVVVNGKWAALIERFPSWYQKALWQWPLIHPFPRQIMHTSLSNRHLEALEVKLVQQNGNVEWHQILAPEKSKLHSAEHSEVRVWDPPQAALIWGSVRHFSLLWLHRLKVFRRRRVYYIFLWFCFSSTEIQQIICKSFQRYRRAVLLSPCDATLKAHEGKPISLSSDTRVLGFYAFRCATHTHTHAPTRWHAGESHWLQRSGMKRTSAHLHQHTPALCRAVNTAIVFWPHFLLGGDKSLFHSHARNKIQLYP